MEDMKIFEKNYNKISVNVDMLLVEAWNMFDGEEKIFLNDKDFFEDFFENNPYNAAWAASAGDYRQTDKYVYINEDGYLSSFSHWNDEASPIKIDRIDISSLQEI